MTFAYLFLDAVFEIFSTSLFQYFWGALLVSATISFIFAFLLRVYSDDDWGNDD